MKRQPAASIRQPAVTSRVRSNDLRRFLSPQTPTKRTFHETCSDDNSDHNDKATTTKKKSSRPNISTSTTLKSKNGGSAFYACPLCQVHFAWYKLQEHAATCQGNIITCPSAKIMTIQKKDIVSSSSSSTANSCESNNGNRAFPKQKQNYSLDNNDDNKFVAESNNNNNNNNITTLCDPKRMTNSSSDTQRNYPLTDTTFSNLTTKKVKPTSMPLPGLHLYEDFITPEEEAQILATLDGKASSNSVRPHPGDDIDDNDVRIPWKAATFNGRHFGKRWGVHCNLRTRQVTPPQHPLPRFITDILVPKFQKALQLPETMPVAFSSWTPNEANAIDYRRRLGHELQNHVDDRHLSKEPIANLSLAGDCYMTFCLETNKKLKHSTIRGDESLPLEKQVLLKRRCLQVLTGKARYHYSHGIRNKDLLSDRRVSLTMRESPLTSATSSSGQVTTSTQPTLHDLLQKKK